MTAVLGGGIAGLSAAYYALKNPKIGAVVLFEASNRVGGWVRSYQLPNGIIFEKGPRTIRCSDRAAQNTLSLVEELQIADKVIPIKSNHSVAKNRMIYAKEQLHLLPNSFSSLFKSNSLLDRPLIGYLLTDLKAKKVTNDDESIYNFVARRFGQDIADYLISPMICGICAGDAQKISVNFLMRHLFEMEQKYGSIIKGLLMDFIKESLVYNKKENNNKQQDVHLKKDTQNLAEKAKFEKWTVCGLKGGLEQLPCALEKNLRACGVDIQLDSDCQELWFKDDHIELTINGNSRKYKNVISSLPAKKLAELIRPQHVDLATQLESIPMVTVAVVNLQFSDNVLPMSAFGVLVPPKEQLPILGVIFDSCIFPQNSTVLTVMMGGAWFEQYFGKDPSDEYLLNTAVNQVKNILNIKEDPIAFNVAVLKDCIPQYVVGHKQRIDQIRDYISSHKLSLALCGSSYQGVGVNDVILSAKEAVAEIV